MVESLLSDWQRSLDRAYSYIAESMLADWQETLDRVREYTGRNCE